MQIDPNLELEVPATYLDSNGHMNIRHYFDLGAQSILSRWRELGRSSRGAAARPLSLFTAEHHLRYLREMRVGEHVSMHAQMLDRSHNAAHAMAFLVNRSTMELSFTFEAVVVHMDLQTRRAAPFADDVAAKLDAEIERLGNLGWDAPVCGAMGIRPR